MRKLTKRQQQADEEWKKREAEEYEAAQARIAAEAEAAEKEATAKEDKGRKRTRSADAEVQSSEAKQKKDKKGDAEVPPKKMGKHSRKTLGVDRKSKLLKGGPFTTGDLHTRSKNR